MRLSGISYKLNPQNLIILIIVSFLIILFISEYYLQRKKNIYMLEGMDTLNTTTDTNNITTTTSDSKNTKKTGLVDNSSSDMPAASNSSIEADNNLVGKEGFSNNSGSIAANNAAYGPEYSASKSPSYILNPSTWSMPNLVYSAGARPDKGVQSILNRPKQPIPLPKGELDMFASTAFKPECCPNTFSNSEGCACMTVPQYKYLIERGGNNVPYSEY
jgi:hypothetical protein